VSRSYENTLSDREYTLKRAHNTLTTNLSTLYKNLCQMVCDRSNVLPLHIAIVYRLQRTDVYLNTHLGTSMCQLCTIPTKIENNYILNLFTNIQ
jgi:hypothetical protein